MSTIIKKLPSLLFLAFCFPSLATAATTGSITLTWNANTESDIAGYRVHYGTASNPFDKLVDVTTTTVTIPNLQNGVTYTFAVTAYNTSLVESRYSEPAFYTEGSPTLIPPAVLANISTRASVQTGEDVMIGGFIIDGIVAKKVALRALGPSLAEADVSGAMSDPVLQLLDSQGAVVASNDGWNIPGEQVSAIGLAPTDARESALVATLFPGAYSAIVSGKGASTGVALFELYDLDAETGRVANISTRSRVQSGDDVMIGGFILGGTTATKVIVRAIGPSLVPRGVTNALVDPTLELYDSNGTRLASNDNWRTTQEAEVVDSTVAPTDERESAIVFTLSPGAYSSIVRGANGAIGVALVEVYALN